MQPKTRHAVLARPVQAYIFLRHLSALSADRTTKCPPSVRGHLAMQQ